MGKTSRSILRTSPVCALEAAVSLIDGKWKCMILFHLMQEGTLRFGELRRLVPVATPRMVTNQLRELEEDQLVRREVHTQRPLRVEYSLTTRGESLIPILNSLRLWGDAHLDLDVPPRESPRRAERTGPDQG